MKKAYWLITLLSFTLPVWADPKAISSAIGSGGISQMVLLLAFIGVFYFMILRPQSKRAKSLQQVISTLQKGDEVMTNGGLIGRIDALSEQFLKISVADDVSIWVQKQAVAHALPKGTLRSLT